MVLQCTSQPPLDMCKAGQVAGSCTFVIDVAQALTLKKNCKQTQMQKGKSLTFLSHFSDVKLSAMLWCSCVQYFQIAMKKISLVLNNAHAFLSSCSYCVSVIFIWDILANIALTGQLRSNMTLFSWPVAHSGHYTKNENIFQSMATGSSIDVFAVGIIMQNIGTVYAECLLYIKGFHRIYDCFCCMVNWATLHLIY